MSKVWIGFYKGMEQDYPKDYCWPGTDLASKSILGVFPTLQSFLFSHHSASGKYKRTVKRINMNQVVVYAGGSVYTLVKFRVHTTQGRSE